MEVIKKIFNPASGTHLPLTPSNSWTLPHSLEHVWTVASNVENFFPDKFHENVRWSTGEPNAQGAQFLFDHPQFSLMKFGTVKDVVGTIEISELNGDRGTLKVRENFPEKWKFLNHSQTFTFDRKGDSTLFTYEGSVPDFLDGEQWKQISTVRRLASIGQAVWGDKDRLKEKVQYLVEHAGS